jgi:ubiquinone/menaquinone biosynthesis C-methylase UbiE
MNNLYQNDEVVQSMTDEIVRKGHSILQVFKLDPDDKTHISMLLKEFAPKFGADVLDAGCGIGAVAKEMHAIRPDLKFTLLNISKSQLALCPLKFKTICADYHDVPLRAKSFDAIMFNYSIGHARLDKVMSEASRLLRPNGLLFIYDMEASECKSLQDHLQYTAFPMMDVKLAALKHGFTSSIVRKPLDTTSDHMKNLHDDETHAKIFKGVSPVIYKFVKS